ncbi:MAG: IS3 family transposase [Deltaproteobacteria bacterium]|nr:MAG: IS3 family transposase [Deltaproteobacteria bacterium]
MKYRRFTQDFKRSLIEQLFSETATPLELCKRCNISSGQLYTWKRQYAQGKLDPETSREAELAVRVREMERLVSKRHLLKRVSKKSRTKQPQTGREKRHFIAENRTLIQSVQRGCELMNLPRRTYYYKPKHTASDEALINRIGDLCLECPRYGYTRVTEQLQREGRIINHKKVVRIMRENNWSCRSEEVSLRECRTMGDVHQRIPCFIEDAPNQKRLHSSLDYKPPCEFEAMVIVTKTPVKELSL